MEFQPESQPPAGYAMQKCISYYKKHKSWIDAQPFYQGRYLVFSYGSFGISKVWTAAYDTAESAQRHVTMKTGLPMGNPYIVYVPPASAPAPADVSVAPAPHVTASQRASAP